jgi:hypothetical protein
LGGLDADEERALVEHLRVCAACEEHHQRLAGLIALIELAGPPNSSVPTPDNLEQKVMARIAAEEIRPPRRSRSRPRPHHRRWATPGLTGVLAGAAATVAVVAGLGLFSGAAKEQSTQPLTVRLQGTRYAPDASATARLSHQLNATTIAFEGTHLPPSRRGEHYAVWLTGRDGAFNAGMFRVGPDGWATTRLSSAAPLDPGSTIDVSVEPNHASASTSASPTTVLKATLPA